ncbi:PaaI family thioesterase [Paenibacillus sp. 481]|uniref:PaaI family thioesterase n=1 Tax=Paenibacillus sp. 481 TaxID=2835869 RepID=UPI001E5535D9|nr:PaaI family thioesterase [Paenibacillus sp. 481]UHA73859.1 PaaI family thioesterase [Paenibacillus sp. 481]
MSSKIEPRDVGAEQVAHTFWDYLGCELVRADEHEAIVHLHAKEHHLNMMGIVNGGVLASLLDNTMGVVAMEARPGKQVVTSNLNLNYLRPMPLGRLEVRAHIVHQTRRMLTIQGDVQDEQGNVGTIATATFCVKS